MQVLVGEGREEFLVWGWSGDEGVLFLMILLLNDINVVVVNVIVVIALVLCLHFQIIDCLRNEKECPYFLKSFLYNINSIQIIK